MTINLVSFDVDDSASPHPHGGKRAMGTVYQAKPVVERLNRYVYFSANTGQNREAVYEVLDALELRGDHVFEMGYLIGQNTGPLSRTMLPGAHPAADELEAFRLYVSENGDVKAYAAYVGLEADIIRGKEAMVSFEIVDGRGQEFIENALPGLLVGHENLRRHVDSGEITTLNANYAVDLVPRGVDKGSGLRQLMKMHDFRPEQTLAIVDSGHSDMPFVEVVKGAGFAACPANATHDIKAAVTAMGERGYVSEFTCEQGAFVNILLAAEGKWGFV